MVAQLDDQSLRHTARGLVMRGGKLLLMERWRDIMHYFSIPGGGIEKNETAEETVIREIFEETSIKVKPVRLVLEMHDGDLIHHIYLCEYIEGEPYLAEDSPEMLETTSTNRFKPGWLPIDEVKNMPMVYWEPVRGVLINGLQKGFPEEVTIVRADHTR